jgi:hopanoid biosynthesis associated RND transporter like protein HpnN
MRAEREVAKKRPFIERLAMGTVTWVCRRPWTVLACSLVFVILSIYLASTYLQFHTQRSDLIGSRTPNAQRWNKFLAEFGADDDIVVVFEGHDRQRMQEAIEELAGEIDKQQQLFERLFYKVDLRHIRNRALMFLPSEQIAQIQGNLKNMTLLLDPPFAGALDPLESWKMLSLGSLLEEAASRVKAIRANGGLRPGDKEFLMQMNSISSCAARVIDDPARYSNPWQSILPPSPEQKDMLAEPQYFFSGDGTLAFLLVQPVKQAGSFTAAKASVEALRKIIEKTQQSYGDLKLGVTGLPVLENDEMVASQADTNMASWLALAAVWVLFLMVYRGIRYPLMTVSILLVGTAWAMGWLTLTVGHLNILSATFAVMLIGMGDYGVLWVTRFDQERSAGADLLTALRNTARTAGLGIVTAAATTALAFFAAMFADFQAVAELGWIAGCGILFCAISCFVVMPALLRLFDRRSNPVPAIIPIRTRAWLPLLAKRPRWVIATSLGATVLLACFAVNIGYDHNLLHLQAEKLDSVQWEQTLIEHTAGASWYGVSSTDTPEGALAVKARFEQLPCVSRVVEVASLVPRDQAHKVWQLLDIQHRLRRLPARATTIPHALPEPGRLMAQAARVLAEVEPLMASGGDPYLVELKQKVRLLHDKLGAAKPEQAADRLKCFDEALTRDLVDDMHRLLDVSTPREIGLDDLPASLRDRFVGKSGKWLIRVFAKESLWEYEPLQAFVAAIRTVDPEATGKPFGTLEGLRCMKQGFEWAGLYALLAIVAVFFADFRNLRYVLIALAPLAMGLIFSLGILHLFGLALNPANMIAFPLILGVGADNGVHVLRDFLSSNRSGGYTLGWATGRGIFVKALTAIFGFATLMLSQHRGLASLGLILTLGVSCCMLTALVFLPAVLRLLSSKHGPEHQVEEQPEPKKCVAA